MHEPPPGTACRDPHHTERALTPTLSQRAREQQLFRRPDC
jgi:hypothetical protein